VVLLVALVLLLLVVVELVVIATQYQVKLQALTQQQKALCH
jgi:hypothetical protein